MIGQCQKNNKICEWKQKNQETVAFKLIKRTFLNQKKELLTKTVIGNVEFRKVFYLYLKY